MKLYLTLGLFLFAFHSFAQEQRIGDTTATGIVSYSLRAVNGKGTGNRPVFFDSLGRLMAGSSSSLQAWSLSGNTGIDTTTTYIGTNDNKPVIFKANNTEALRITPSGQLAIGTTNAAGYKLAVGGNLIAERIKVKLQSAGWPDYVFAPNYRLPTLKEVEAYVIQHNHLPEVPSAGELKKDGLDMEDMQAALLKKIEELTLYMIEADKKIAELEKKVSTLSKKKN